MSNFVDQETGRLGLGWSVTMLPFVASDDWFLDLRLWGRTDNAGWLRLVLLGRVNGGSCATIAITGFGVCRYHIECDHRAAAVAKHECRGFPDGLQHGDSASTLLGHFEIIRMIHRAATTGPTVVDNDFEAIRKSFGNCRLPMPVSATPSGSAKCILFAKSLWGTGDEPEVARDHHKQQCQLAHYITRLTLSFGASTPLVPGIVSVTRPT